MCILVCFYVASTPAAHVRGPRLSLRSLDRKFAPSALARVGGVDVDDTPSPRRLHANPLLETAWTLLSRVACLKQGR